MSTLTQNERQALGELFIALSEKKNFFAKLKEARKELKYLFKQLFQSKKHTKNPTR